MMKRAFVYFSLHGLTVDAIIGSGRLCSRLDSHFTPESGAFL
jgi:hypothetical protein